LRRLLHDNTGSSIPIILFVLTIVVCGALYSLFFLEVGFGLLALIPIPPSDGKTFIMMCMYAIPLFVMVVGSVALLLQGLKNDSGWYSQ